MSRAAASGKISGSGRKAASWRGHAGRDYEGTATGQNDEDEGGVTNGGAGSDNGEHGDRRGDDGAKANEQAGDIALRSFGGMVSV